eukprot:COSAG02_NODE_1243_length_13681_cov_55.123767_7_plen_98_part_00
MDKKISIVQRSTTALMTDIRLHEVALRILQAIQYTTQMPHGRFDFANVVFVAQRSTSTSAVSGRSNVTVPAVMSRVAFFPLARVAVLSPWVRRGWFS